MSPDPPPRWKPPGRYGQAAAIDGMGLVASPFLAGIAIALAVLVISNEKSFGWVGETLFALVVATIAFIACAECAFVARKYAATPSQIEEWWPDRDDRFRTGRLEQDQAEAKAGFDLWSAWARRAYNCAIVAFSVGVAALLVPAGGLTRAGDWRLAVFALAVAAIIAELTALMVTLDADQKRRHGG